MPGDISKYFQCLRYVNNNMYRPDPLILKSTGYSTKRHIYAQSKAIVRRGTFETKLQPGNADIGNGSREKDPFKIYPIGCLDSLTEGVG